MLRDHLLCKHDPRSNDSSLYSRFLMIPTISGNLLLARSNTRNHNHIGFWNISGTETVRRICRRASDARCCGRADRWFRGAVVASNRENCRPVRDFVFRRRMAVLRSRERTVRHRLEHRRAHRLVETFSHLCFSSSKGHPHSQGHIRFPGVFCPRESETAAGSTCCFVDFGC